LAGSSRKFRPFDPPRVEHSRGTIQNRSIDPHLNVETIATRERKTERSIRMTLSLAFLALQKFSSVQAQVHNHFNQERHLVTREVYKQRRSVALAEWRALAAYHRLGLVMLCNTPTTYR
jgi:putative transposase